MATKVTNTTEKVEVVETEKKAAVNVLDLLLGADADKIKLPTSQVEITRLSEALGDPFILTCQALTPEKYEEVQDMALSVSGKDVDLDVSQLQLFTVMEGVVDAEGKPLFKSKELRDKYKVPTPKEVVKKVLLSGEIVAVYTVIAKLTGFDDTAVKQVKN
ncbi:phage tail assembly chaperone [Hominenteromicrobium sp.]|uniref:phage tail assembly chaperone n=1 Tax=Hominenteromicrobium sp. TaxID=3073581 RepID=UPI003AB306F9